MTQLSKRLKPHEDDIQEHIEDNPMVFTLNQPTRVTVKTSEGRYFKKPLIGEESFEATSCYVGKKGDLIFVFKPVDDTGETGKDDYSSMEMKVDEAYSKLDDFADYIKTAINKDVVAEQKAAALESRRLKEELELKKREEVYGDTFGNWA